MIVRYGDGLVGFDIPDDSPLALEIASRRDVYAATKAALVAEAREQVARYPQYADHFDDGQGWQLAVAKRNVETKGGLRFAKGETYLARIKSDPDDDFYGRIFGWSRSGGIETLVNDGDLVFLTETGKES